jgi:hypothetical protein
MSLPRLFLESLESRIAPAVIVVGPTAYGGQEYTSAGTPFKDASSVPVDTGHGSFSGFVDGSNYYLKLKAGDTLVMASSGGQNNFITVSAGTVDAFFVDTNHTGIPTASELTGLSLSAGSKLVVSGSVNGDIIANLNAATGQIEVNNLISNKQSIASLTVNNVAGSIIAGGGISKLSVGTVTDIASGISADTAYSFGGSPTVGAATLTSFSSNPAQGNGFLPAAKLAGASLSNISVNSAAEIIAGGGGAGAAGGSISNVTVISDSTGIVIQGGLGGAGSGTVSNGGAGGQVSQVVMYGIPDTTDNSVVDILGGIGGNALGGSNGAGGNGGLVSKVWVGYQPASPTSKTLVPSQNWLHDDVTVHGGNGGEGVTAGNGGAVNNTTLLTATPLLLSHDIQVLGGNGGAVFSNGKKAGAGGSVTTFNIQDLVDTASSAGISTVLVEGGDASSTINLTSLTCAGAAGGSVTNAASATGALAGESFDFVGGNGSAGTQTGGNGGSISNIGFAYGGSSSDELLQSLSITTGTGGYSTTGNGGAGGNLSGLFAPDTSLVTLPLTIGDGGASGSAILGAGAIGGKGGSISSVSIGADDALDTSFATLIPTAGNGGDGYKGGGAGGSIQNFSYFIPSTNIFAQASCDATAGNGGTVLGASGNGGAGGSLSGISLSTQVPDILTNGFFDNQFVTLNAGNGGDAAGTGTAGAGGSITKSNTQTIDDVNFYAGNGGDAGTKGRVGAGGSIGSSTAALGIFADSADGSIGYFAGSAGSATGATVGKGAAGGSVINAVASAEGNITFTAGDGSFGGNGGNISQIAFYGATGNTALPYGNTSVIAGNGGDAISSTTASGAGGSVTNAAGYTSGDPYNTAAFQAGNGGSGGKGGVGGSFTGLTIYGGDVNFGVVAGNGGSGTSSGGVGGSVSNLAVQSNLSNPFDGVTTGTNATIYAIAAGSGGSVTTGKGAAGGSVTNINVAGDIGVMTGVDYGFATDGSAMGGIFAGVGGTGSTGSGLNGNVTKITAEAISAIVAGTGSSPSLVNKVDGVYLSGNTAPTVDATGAFTNFPTPTETTTTGTPPSANVVGGKAGDPTAAGADDFQLVGGSSLTPSGSGSSAWTLGTTDPIDGLVAALTMTANRNFTPLAFLTTDTTQTSGYGLFLPPPNVVTACSPVIKRKFFSPP